MKEPVIIIKYFAWLKILPLERHIVFELCRRDSRARDGWKVIRTLDRFTALDMIEENELELIVSNEFGTIWEGMIDLKPTDAENDEFETEAEETEEPITTEL